MAIISAIPGIEVTVEIDEEPLKEYLLKENGPSRKNEIKEYIESTAGAEFRIGIRIDRKYKRLNVARRQHPDFSIRAYVDGNLVLQKAIMKGRFGETRYFQTCKTKDGDKWVGKVFTFSSIGVGMKVTRSVKFSNIWN
jgi:hypothetical protein